MAVKNTYNRLVFAACMWVIVYFWVDSNYAVAQQLSIDATKIEGIEVPYLLPSCAHTEGNDGCQVVILEVESGLVADYDEQTTRIRESTNNFFQYSRTRTNRIYVISFPPGGGGLKFEVPGQNMIDNNLRIDQADAGVIRYYCVNTTEFSGRLTQRRLRRDTRGITPGLGQKTVGQSESDHAEEDDKTVQPEQVAEAVPVHALYSARQLLVSLNYMFFIRNSSNLYRGSNLFGNTNGDGLSVSLHYINGFKSGKIGVTYLKSRGNFRSVTGTGEFTENVRHSHISLFASFSPVIQLFGDQFNSGYLFIDIGIGINYLDHSYSDIEEIINPTYREIITYRYNADEEILPSAIGSVGFIYNYQNIGLNLGLHYEGIYDYNTEAFLNTFYPRVGLNFTL